MKKTDSQKGGEIVFGRGLILTLLMGLIYCSTTQANTKAHYTWADFMTQQDCGDFYNTLKTDINNQDLIQNIAPYCQTKMTVWQDWLKTFREEKRNILIQEVMNQKSKYLKYLRVIPYLLIDIQKTTDTGLTPQALLNQIEQSVIQHHPQKTLELITLLPPHFQQGLYQTESTTKTLLKIRNSLNKFNRSLL